jgi:hypothetical protein
MAASAQPARRHQTTFQQYRTERVYHAANAHHNTMLQLNCICAMPPAMGIRTLLVALLLTACADAPDAPAPPAAWTVRLLLPQWWGRDEAAGVPLTVRDPSGATRTLVSDARGELTLPSAAGRYTFTVDHPLDAAAVFALTGHRREARLTVTTEVVRSPNDRAPAVVRLAAPRLGGLVIREFYYTGARGVTPDAHYFSDQFVEVTNNATEPLSVGGLLIADLDGASGPINPGTRPTAFQSDPAHVYASNIWRIPGADGDHMLAPGESVVLAQDGTNHMPDSPLDHSDADWETYVERADMRDRDHPTVPNLTREHFTGGVDWLVTVFGPALVIFRAPDVAALTRASTPIGARVRVPVADVIDGVEALMNADSAAFKRLPPTIDRGFVAASGTYTGESARRRPAAMVRGRTVWQDSDDTAADFEWVDPPTPRHQAPTP